MAFSPLLKVGQISRNQNEMTGLFVMYSGTRHSSVFRSGYSLTNSRIYVLLFFICRRINFFKEGGVKKRKPAVRNARIRTIRNRRRRDSGTMKAEIVRSCIPSPPGSILSLRSVYHIGRRRPHIRQPRIRLILITERRRNERRI